MVGNGATNWDFDVSPSFPETLFSFNLIPNKYMDFFLKSGCVYYFNDFRPHSGPAGCDTIWAKMQKLVADLDWYDLYLPPQGALMTEAERIGKTVVGGEERTYKIGRTKAEYTPWVKHFGNNSTAANRVEGDFLSEYMNRNDTRAALHIPDFVQTWAQCSDKIVYHLQNEASMWIYPILKANNIKLLFYSGDTDGAVPTYGTKRWIKELNWPIMNEWRQWKTDSQVSGYIQQYDGLDFVTIKGVGHMSP